VLHLRLHKSSVAGVLEINDQFFGFVFEAVECQGVLKTNVQTSGVGKRDILEVVGEWASESVNRMEGFNMLGNEESGVMGRKRVMVVVDDTSHSKHAMMWALTHVTNKGDSLTLLHIVPPHKGSEPSCSTNLVNYLASLCKDCKPGVSWLCLLLLSFFIYCVQTESRSYLLLFSFHSVRLERQAMVIALGRSWFKLVFDFSLLFNNSGVGSPFFFFLLTSPLMMPLFLFQLFFSLDGKRS